MRRQRINISRKILTVRQNKSTEYNIKNNSTPVGLGSYSGVMLTTIGEEKKWNPNVGENIGKDKFILIEKGKNRPYPKKFYIAVPANMNCGKVLRK